MNFLKLFCFLALLASTRTTTIGSSLPDKIDSLQMYSDLTNQQRLDSALALLGSTSQDDVVSKRKLFNIIALGYYRATEFDSSIHYFQKAIALDSSRFDNDLFISERGLAKTYNQIGNLETSWKHIEKALFIAQELDSADNQASAYINMGNILLDNSSEDQVPQAIQYYEQALNLTTKKLTKASVYTSLANCHFALDSIDLALSLYEKSRDQYIALDKPDYAIIPMFNIALIHYDQADYNKALGSCRELEKLNNGSWNRIDSLELYNLTAITLRQLQRYPEAINYHLKSLKIVDHLQYIDTENVYLDIAETYTKVKNWEKAYTYLKLYKELHDSLNNVSQRQIVSELATKYETQEKQSKIEQLEIEQENLKLKADQEELIRYAIIFGSLLLLISASIIIYVIRQKLFAERAEQMIREQEQAKTQELLMIKTQIEAQEKEKQRIAQHLHDGVAGTLAGIKHTLSAQSGKDSAVLSQIDTAYHEIRTLSHHLANPQVFGDNLIYMIQKYLDEIQSLHSIEVDFQSPSLDKVNAINHNILVEFHRIIQESVTNILKHAEATFIEVILTIREDEINLMIEDDGKGFDTEKTSYGLGINSIESRVRVLNGNMHIDSRPGRGTAIDITVPNV